MAKESGIGWTTLTVDNASGSPQDVKNDVTNLEISTPRAVQDVTGIDKSAIERILLLADCSMTLTTVFNDAANRMFAVFSTVPSTSVARTVAMTVSGQTLANEILFTDFPLTRAQGGELTAAIPGVLADGTVPTWTT
jgi:hypothetical protein